MAKTYLLDTLKEDDKKKLGVGTNINLSVGSVHGIKITEEDKITLKEEDKERGYRQKMVVIVAIKDGVYYTTLINSEANKRCVTATDIEQDFHPITGVDYSFIIYFQVETLHFLVQILLVSMKF